MKCIITIINATGILKQISKTGNIKIINIIFDVRKFSIQNTS